MKTVTVFIILCSATACSAPAQNAGEQYAQEALQETWAAEQDRLAAERERGNALREEGELLRAQIEEDKVKPIIESIRSLPAVAPFPGLQSGSGKVVVIPASEIETKGLAAIMEDMNVMSRILDKALQQIRQLPRAGYGSGMYGGGDVMYGGDFSFAFNPFGGGTEGIFLDGYGALFLMKVDFPLSPPPEETQEEKVEEESTDDIWKQAKQEIYEPQKIIPRRKREPAKYDAEKVEALKRTLTESLKHASNIRNLKSDNWVIFTINGGGQRSNIIGVSTGHAQVIVKDNESKVMSIGALPSTGIAEPLPATVLTIRAKKSDIDSFAGGKLDFDQFRQKVQTFIY